MKKTRVLAMLVSLMLLATMALAESADDPVVVKAGDAEILLSEAQDFYDYYYQQYVILYMQNGLTFTDTDAASLRDAIVDSLVQTAIMDNKIAEYGLGEISEEDQEALREEVYAEFEVDLAAYAESIGLSLEEARETAAEQGVTVELIFEQSLANLPYTRLQEYVFANVEVTDEEIAAEYDAYVEEDKTLFENDAASYEMYSMYYGAQDIYYTPAGFRYVKHILLGIPDTVAAEMTDIDADISASSDKISALVAELDALETPEEGEGDEASAEEATADEAAPRTADEINAELTKEQENYDALEAKYQEAKGQVLPTLQPTIDEINQKLEAGTSFDALIEEYNTDPGMATNPEGYKVHKDSVNWVTEFRDAAMALESIGDVSEPVLTEYGIHIIQYIGDVPSGPVPMTDELRETLRESLLVTREDEAYSAAYEEWLTEYEVETHPELIKLPTDAAGTDDTGTADEADPTPSAEPEATDEPNEDGTVG